MDLRPGQLILTKTTFEASEIPLDYSDQLRLCISKRKTLRRVKIDKNMFLLVVDIPEDTSHFFPGWTEPVIAKRIIFLLGNKLCISTSIQKWSEYLEPVDYVCYKTRI